MKKQAYSQWQTLMYESLVRACEVRYAYYLGEQLNAERNIKNQVKKGFEWTGELSDELARYEDQKDRYPTLESYMPNLIKFFDNYADTHD